MAKASATTVSAEEQMNERVRIAREAAAQRAVSVVDADYQEEGEAVAPERAITVVPAPVVDRSQQIEQEDMILPRLALAQAISKVVQNEQARAGEWVLNLDNESLGKEVEMIPLSYSKHRSLFVTGQGLVCRSYDLVQGVGTPGGDCDSCPLKDWQVDENGKTIGGPPCQLNYDFVALVRAAGTDDPHMPVMLSFRGTGAKPARQFITNAVNRRSTPEGKVEWHKDTYVLSSTRESGKKGTFHVPTIVRLGATPPELVELAEARIATLDRRVTVRSAEAREGDE